MNGDTVLYRRISDYATDFLNLKPFLPLGRVDWQAAHVGI